MTPMHTRHMGLKRGAGQLLEGCVEAALEFVVADNHHVLLVRRHQCDAFGSPGIQLWLRCKRLRGDGWHQTLLRHCTTWDKSIHGDPSSATCTNQFKREPS